MFRKILNRVVIAIQIILILSVTGIVVFISLMYAWDADHPEHVNKYVFFILWALVSAGLLYTIFRNKKEK
jgi:hypothetical protein